MENTHNLSMDRFTYKVSLVWHASFLVHFSVASTILLPTKILDLSNLSTLSRIWEILVTPRRPLYASKYRAKRGLQMM